MKAHHVLTPLAFGLAMVVSAGAFASGNPPVSSGASAMVKDTQMLDDNYVKNMETVNSASMAGSGNNTAGSLTVNLAAGDNNQQANAGALSAADAFFVLGLPLNASAVATINLKQEAYYNELVNWATSNSATLINSVNQSSGNIAVNTASGNFNQQKNDFSVAYSQKAFTAAATADLEQHSHYNEIYNYDVASGHKPVIVTPVVNNAAILGSLNGLSGYVGVNMAAGGANQQSNALAIAAGCTTCQK